MSIIAFGKYKGNSLSYILNNDPDYIIWLPENTDYSVSDTILQQAIENSTKHDMDIISEIYPESSLY